MSLITQFDPWHSRLCTCPSKLTLNPYTGCDHACVYCYASSYIPQFQSCRPKRDLIPRLAREAIKLKGEIVSMSNSSDPYPNLERRAGLTRQCLAVLSQSKCRIQVITKSNLVTRDVDLLKKVPSMVSLTITAINDKTGKLLEPQAPEPSKRLETVRILRANNIATSVRIDPIIPFVNDNAEDLIIALAAMDVKHVTCSTYKVRMDSWKRLSKVFPRVAEKLKPLYFEAGERMSGYTYLPKNLRFKLMKDMLRLAEKNGMRFGTCREGLSQLNTAVCDGSWLINNEENT